MGWVVRSHSKYCQGRSDRRSACWGDLPPERKRKSKFLPIVECGLLVAEQAYRDSRITTTRLISNPRRRNSSQATSGSKACKTQIFPLLGSSAEPPLLERTTFNTVQPIRHVVFVILKAVYEGYVLTLLCSSQQLPKWQTSWPKESKKPRSQK